MHEYCLSSITSALKSKHTDRYGFWGSLKTELRYAYLPTKVCSGKRVWLTEYVRLEMPWSGMKGGGVCIAYLTVDEHAEWLKGVDSPAVKPVEAHKGHLRLVK